MHVTGGSGRHVEQITNELRDGYHIEGLEEVRVIRDRQTSKIDTPSSKIHGCPDGLQKYPDSSVFSDSETSIIRALFLSATFRPFTSTAQALVRMTEEPKSASHIAGKERIVLAPELRGIGLARTWVAHYTLPETQLT